MARGIEERRRAAGHPGARCRHPRRLLVRRLPAPRRIERGRFERPL